MDFMRKLSFMVFLLCVLISLKKENAETKEGFPNGIWPASDSGSSISETPPLMSRAGSLEYDFYRESCPQAEQIIRSAVRRFYRANPNAVPALLRLLFHDCFIEGCDASVLLDPADGLDSEKDCPPNETLKGFSLIDIIKFELEEVCPATVSCADIVVLAARESVALEKLQNVKTNETLFPRVIAHEGKSIKLIGDEDHLIVAGGPFYPLQTGRRDSYRSFLEAAAYQLPSPQDNLQETIAKFASRGFSERETVGLLGSHSIGTIHCEFILNRLYNFGGTDEPDPTIDIEFLNQLRSRCSNSNASFSSSPLPSPSPLPQEPGVQMDYGEKESDFGILYYRNLLQARGILYVDQQLTAGEETENWVRAYASDVSLFRRDFARVMMKLSNLRVLTTPTGQVRVSCRKVA